MPATFQDGTDWQQSSGPHVIVSVQESDCWPVDDRSGTGTKDQLDNGLHPVIAIGDRAAPTRPLNVTGVVTAINMSVLGTATDRVQVNIAHGAVVRQYVSNTLTYANDVPATFETTPTVGQPVYVDDSNDLAEGVTLSMSPLNDADLENPLAGVLWYCQDEIADGQAGGARATTTFDTALPDEETEQEFCVMLVAGFRELA
jgi:hypothetical protein